MTSTAIPNDADSPRKQQILLAARTVFAEVGFGTARVDEIARRAGCNKGLIYYYFKSKEQLYDAVIAATIHHGAPLLQAVRGQGVAHWLDALASFTAGIDSREWVRLLAMEGLDDDRISLIAHEAERAASWRDSVQLLVRAQAHGEIDPDLDSEMLVLMFVMSTLGSQMFPQVTRLITGLPPTSSAFVDRLRQFHLALAASLAPGHDAQAGD